MTDGCESAALVASELPCCWNNSPSLTSYFLCRPTLDDAQIEVAAPGLDVHDHTVPRPYGDAWVREARSPALRVPSAVMPYSFNCLLNPGHAAFGTVHHEALGEFVYDGRLARLVGAPRSSAT